MLITHAVRGFKDYTESTGRDNNKVLDPAQICSFVSQPSSLILVNKQQPCPTPTYLNATKTLAARLTCKPSDTVMEEKGPVIR